VAARTILPMKAVPGELPSDLTGWGFEVKWDGYRAILFVEPAGRPRVRVQSSNGLDLTARWPELDVVADEVHAESVILDGEAVVFEAGGRTDFGRLARGDGPVTFVAFDLLALNDNDTSELTLTQRRRLLEQVLDGSTHVVVSPLHDDGHALADATAAAGMEGIVAKRLDSRYQPGRRSPSWRKIKHRRRQEFVVVGWQESDRARSSTFASLILAVNEPTEAPRPGLRFCGSVGTGFDQATLLALRTQLDRLHVEQAPLLAPPPRGAVTRPHWVQPELVAEVEFAEWTDDDIIRHASFLGLREDKGVRDVVRET
jgi:bifunctional non-homologous end joining protein LigD